MSQPFDASRSLTSLEQDSTIIAVIEMSQAKWLVAAVVPGVERQPLKRLDADGAALLKLLHRWRNEAGQAGREIKRIVVAYVAGRDGFWLARWLRARGVEAYVIHPASIAVSREHRRAKTDRLDTKLLCAPFSAGYAARSATAAWWRSQRSRTRTQDGRTTSEATWSLSRRGS
jgi:transposase